MKAKKAPLTLFGLQIKNNPKAHELSVALGMSGIATDIPTADLILRVFNAMEKMGGDFDLMTACKIQQDVLDEYELIRNNFENKLNNKTNKKTKHGSKRND